MEDKFFGQIVRAKAAMFVGGERYFNNPNVTAETEIVSLITAIEEHVQEQYSRTL